MDIVPYEPRYLPGLELHFATHWEESGTHGVHFLPFDLDKPSRPRGLNPEACEKDFNEIGWQRWFLVLDANVVVGHLGLKSDPMEAGQHRCELGMGLQSAIRNQGIGSALMNCAIHLASSVEHLKWIDLRVMAQNAHAIALYRKFGFEEQGLTKERFHIQGKFLDELMMALKLG